MIVYLVNCNWNSSWQVGIFSSQAGANRAMEKHIAWMKSTLRSSDNISKNDYEIREIPLDKIVDEWYNDTIE